MFEKKKLENLIISKLPLTKKEKIHVFKLESIINFVCVFV